MIVRGSTRPLVVLDCDSTLIQDEVIDLLAEAAGTRDRVAEITQQAMQGGLDFTASLADRVATLRGTPDTVFATVYPQLRLSSGATELIAAVHARGGSVGVVSGGFHELLDPLATQLGLNFWRAHRLEVRQGALTGRISGPVIDAAAKAAALREWAATTHTPMSATIAVGDGANDLMMLDAAAIGVAFNAKPIVRTGADVVIQDDLALVIPLLDRLPGQ